MVLNYKKNIFSKKKILFININIDLPYILGDDETKKLSHRQKQRAARRIKKKEEIKLIRKEKKKGVKKEDNVQSKCFYIE